MFDLSTRINLIGRRVDNADEDTHHLLILHDGFIQLQTSRYDRRSSCWTETTVPLVSWNHNAAPEDVAHFMQALALLDCAAEALVAARLK